MIYVVWTHMPNVVTNILYPERTKLARYVACSLALCTKGCDDNSGVVDRICLENNSKTHECDLTCKDLCGTNWPEHKACGPNYYINLSLQGKGPLGGVQLKGLYKVSWEPNLELGAEYCNRRTDLQDLINYYIKIKDYPNFPYSNDIIGNDNLFGAIYDIGDDWVGSGAIYLEPEVARTDYGCFKQSPFTFGSNIFCGCNAGYYQCQFQGDLHIWAVQSTSNSNYADVIINSSIPEPGFYTVKGVWVRNGDSTEIRTKLNQIETYDITITNQLKTGSSFDLEIISTTDPQHLCSLSDNSVWINDNANGVAEMNCMSNNPSDAGKTYKIKFKVTPSYGTPNTIEVRFIVTGLEIEVKAQNPPDPNNPKHAVASKGAQAWYNVKVTSKFPTEETFSLSAIPDNPAVQCSLDPTITVPAESFALTQMSCSSDVPGTYGITVNTRYDQLDMSASDTASLKVLTGCKLTGDSLNLQISSDPTPVVPGSQLKFDVDGFEGCNGKVIDISVIDPELKPIQCPVTNAAGDKCEVSNIIANSPGTYKFIASMETDDGLEMGSATLTINAPSELANPPCTEKCKDNDGNDKWCSYSLGSADCNGILLPGGDPGICGMCGNNGCQYACDPQSCQEDQTGQCTSASNICCFSETVNSNVLSSISTGPGYLYEYSIGGNTYHTPIAYVSCLTSDPHKDDGDPRWQNPFGFYYGPKNLANFGLSTVWGIDDVRNILVQNGRNATFKDEWCGDNSDCTGKFDNTYSPPDSLVDATCVSFESGHNACQLPLISGPGGPYASWLYINIGGPRPVYGVQLVTQHKCNKGLGGYSDFGLFLHNSSGWFSGGDDNFIGGCLSDVLIDRTVNIKPNSGWVWDNIDAILITYIGKHWNAGGQYYDKSADIDYIGLLTKDPSNTPFCKYGTGDYNRIVNDDKSCYWRLNCPTNGNGWASEQSIKLGPIKNLDPGFDCNKAGTCGGKGYLEFCHSGGSWGVDKCDGNQDKKICYYDVSCMYGGWSGKYKVCDNPLDECNPVTGC